MRRLIGSSALVATALFAAAPGALAQMDTQSQATNRFCLQQPGSSGTSDCSYATLAQCEAAKRSQGGASMECVPANENVGSGTRQSQPPR